MNPASRYVKRCIGAECQRVLGRTSFRALRGGGRSDLCRTCEMALTKDAVAKRAKYASLSAARSRLKKQLAAVERERLALRLDMGRSA